MPQRQSHADGDDEDLVHSFSPRTSSEVSEDENGPATASNTTVAPGGATRPSRLIGALLELNARNPLVAPAPAPLAVAQRQRGSASTPLPSVAQRGGGDAVLEDIEDHQHHPTTTTVVTTTTATARQLSMSSATTFSPPSSQLRFGSAHRMSSGNPNGNKLVASPANHHDNNQSVNPLVDTPLEGSIGFTVAKPTTAVKSSTSSPSSSPPLLSLRPATRRFVPGEINSVRLGWISPKEAGLGAGDSGMAPFTLQAPPRQGGGSSSYGSARSGTITNSGEFLPSVFHKGSGQSGGAGDEAAAAAAAWEHPGNVHPPQSRKDTLTSSNLLVPSKEAEDDEEPLPVPRPPLTSPGDLNFNTKGLMIQGSQADGGGAPHPRTHRTVRSSHHSHPHSARPSRRIEGSSPPKSPVAWLRLLHLPLLIWLGLCCFALLAFFRLSMDTNVFQGPFHQRLDPFTGLQISVAQAASWKQLRQHAADVAGSFTAGGSGCFTATCVGSTSDSSLHCNETSSCLAGASRALRSVAAASPLLWPPSSSSCPLFSSPAIGTIVRAVGSLPSSTIWQCLPRASSGPTAAMASTPAAGISGVEVGNRISLALQMGVIDGANSLSSSSSDGNGANTPVLFQQDVIADYQWIIHATCNPFASEWDADATTATTFWERGGRRLLIEMIVVGGLCALVSFLSFVCIRQRLDVEAAIAKWMIVSVRLVSYFTMFQPLPGELQHQLLLSASGSGAAPSPASPSPLQRRSSAALLSISSGSPRAPKPTGFGSVLLPAIFESGALSPSPPPTDIEGGGGGVLSKQTSMSSASFGLGRSVADTCWGLIHELVRLKHTFRTLALKQDTYRTFLPKFVLHPSTLGGVVGFGTGLGSGPASPRMAFNPSPGSESSASNKGAQQHRSPTTSEIGDLHRFASGHFQDGVVFTMSKDHPFIVVPPAIADGTLPMFATMDVASPTDAEVSPAATAASPSGVPDNAHSPTSEFPFRHSSGSDVFGSGPSPNHHHHQDYSNSGAPAAMEEDDDEEIPNLNEYEDLMVSVGLPGSFVPGELSMMMSPTHQQRALQQQQQQQQPQLGVMAASALTSRCGSAMSPSMSHRNGPTLAASAFLSPHFNPRGVGRRCGAATHSTFQTVSDFPFVSPNVAALLPELSGGHGTGAPTISIDAPPSDDTPVACSDPVSSSQPYSESVAPPTATQTPSHAHAPTPLLAEQRGLVIPNQLVDQTTNSAVPSMTGSFAAMGRQSFEESGTPQPEGERLGGHHSLSKEMESNFAIEDFGANSLSRGRGSGVGVGGSMRPTPTPLPSFPPLPPLPPSHSRTPRTVSASPPRRQSLAIVTGSSSPPQSSHELPPGATAAIMQGHRVTLSSFLTGPPSVRERGMSREQTQAQLANGGMSLIDSLHRSGAQQPQQHNALAYASVRRASMVCCQVFFPHHHNGVTGAAAASREVLMGVDAVSKLFMEIVSEVCREFQGVLYSMALTTVSLTFNAFEPLPFHEARACLCALHCAKELQERFETHPATHMTKAWWGMCVNSGAAVTGIAGTHQKMAPVIVGDAFTLAKQTVKLCSVLRTHVLVLEPCYHVSRTQVFCLPVDVIGQEGAQIIVFELKGRWDDFKNSIPFYQPMMDGFACMVLHKFEEAEALISACVGVDYNAQRLLNFIRWCRRVQGTGATLLSRPYHRLLPLWDSPELLADQEPLPDDVVERITAHLNFCFSGSGGGNAAVGAGMSMNTAGVSTSTDVVTKLSNHPQGGVSRRGSNTQTGWNRPRLSFLADSVLRMQLERPSVDETNTPSLTEPWSKRTSIDFGAGNTAGASRKSSDATAGSTPSHRSTPVNQQLNATLASSPTTHPALPVEIIDKRTQSVYLRTDRLLGQGAFGAVYQGLSESGGLVALKVLPLNAAEIRAYRALHAAAGGDKHGDGRPPLPPHIDDVLKEASLLSRLAHPNIVQYFATTITQSYLIIITEFMSGGTLTATVNMFGALPIAVVRRYAKDILEGLKFLHSKQIVHRDINPNNVLLSIEGTCKISDFGAAAGSLQRRGAEAEAQKRRASDASARSSRSNSDVQSLPSSTLRDAPMLFGGGAGGGLLTPQMASVRSQHSLSPAGGSLLPAPPLSAASPSPADVNAELVGKVIGTPLFMAPEACRGSATPASDVWGFGIIMCFCFSGTYPYQEADYADVDQFLRRLGRDPSFAPVIPRNTIPHPAAVSMIEQCLQRNENLRPTAAELLMSPFFMT